MIEEVVRLFFPLTQAKHAFPGQNLLPAVVGGAALDEIYHGVAEHLRMYAQIFFMRQVPAHHHAGTAHAKLERRPVRDPRDDVRSDDSVQRPLFRDGDLLQRLCVFHHRVNVLDGQIAVFTIDEGDILIDLDNNGRSEIIGLQEIQSYQRFAGRQQEVFHQAENNMVT